jgi:branched-chain amino acid transport system ATP-binding protein
VPTLSAALAALRTRLDRRAVRRHDPSPLADATLEPAATPAIRPTGGRPTILRLENVTLTYSNGALALDGVDMSLGEGEIVGIVGRNGVGKTSLMRSITGFYRTEGARVSGRIEIAGRQIVRGSPVTSARHGITLVPERDKVFTELTVEEHLRHVGDINAARVAMPNEWALFESKWKTRAGQLSGGERQLLALAMAASLQPRVLLIDEMSLGLSPIAIQRVVAAIRDMQARAGMSVVVVEQNVQVARELCQRVFLMEAGQLQADWNPQLADAVDEAVEHADLEGASDAVR